MTNETDLGIFLDVAIEAAREAGELLLRDFLAPGGAAGHGSHAEADEQAERRIRARLLAATPTWSYRGEETGYVQGADRRFIWLLDPNDGTSAYLEGFRGSAVSIGLLVEGVPVLGVVFAYGAPDNRGDLFAWAEGCGPVRRNGVEVVRPPWATELTPESVVLVSQKADRVPAENLACAQPARIRAEPSVAYRLALVAVGEAEIGTSLAAPGSWDYAGGHALLRASQGGLVDQDGRPVTYTVDGHSQTTSCYFGAPALVGEVASRPWQRVFAVRSHHPGVEQGPYRLCWPVAGRAIADDGLLERAQGCLVGLLAGDALGSMVEFMAARDIVQAYPGGLRVIGPSPVWQTLAGQPTDDSELALLLARTLVERGADTDAIAAAYGYWLTTRPFDVGNATGQALHGVAAAAARGESPAAAARASANRQTEANGALMRQSPLSIWGHALSAADLDVIVRADTALTHPSRVCQDASAAFGIALAAAIREGLNAEDAYQRACAWDHEHGASAVITRALAEARHAPPRYGDHMGHVPIALQNAFYQALHAPSVEEGLVATVMGGGDSDTNAAIAGALLGALHGARAVPAQWRQAVLTCRPQEGAMGVRRPRPQELWPVDALCLAEALLVVGTSARAN